MPPILLLLLAGLALRLFIAYVWFPGEGLSSDLRLFRIWAETLAEHGPGGFYVNAGFADYPPGYLWVLWPMGVLANAIAGLTGAASGDVIDALVKLPAIAADIAVAGLLYWSAKRWRDERTGLLAAGLFLFVPVTWYDSALWGQVDAIGVLLLLGALLLLIEGWSEPAVAIGVLATVTKPQYAIGLVIIGAVLLRRHLLARGTGPVPSPRGWVARLDGRLGGWFTTQQGGRRLVLSAVVGAIVGILAILPFDLPSQASPALASIPIIGNIAGLISVVTRAAAYYPVLTVNAFNVWALIGSNPLAGAISSSDLRTLWSSDSLQLLGPITAASLGAILLLAITAIVAVTLLVRDDRIAILLGFTVLAVAFFAVPTRVHERYLFPAFGVGALVAVMSVRWLWWYLALALTNVANLHAVMTLPFGGYGTPGVQGLPLADFLREPFVVGILADLHTLLFIGLFVAFVRQVSWPALRRYLRSGLEPELSEPDVRGSPASRARKPVVVVAGVAAGPQTQAPTARPRAPTPRASTASKPASFTARFERFRAQRADVRTGATATEPVEAPEGRSRLDRRDLGFLALIVLVVFVTRVYRLDTPRTMYFDERWHATTATEFLQDWRYGLPHDLSEVTHPHLAKYFMAAGLVAFGGDLVNEAGLLDTPVRDATFEPSYADPTAPGGLGGNRIIVATGTEVRVAERGDLGSKHAFSLPGAISVTADPDAHWTTIGTSDGGVWVVNSTDLRRFAQDGTVPTARQVATLVGPVVKVWAVGGGRVAALTEAGRVSMIDASGGGVLADRSFPGLRAVLPFGPPDRHLVALALPDRLAVVDTTSISQIQVLGVDGGALGLAYLDGGDQVRRERNLLQQPTIYVVTGGASLATYTVAPDGTLTPGTGIPMPGPVTDIRWDRPTNLVHVLGTSPKGKPTIYVVELHGNAVFADAELGFTPTAWILDVQPADPGNDRERAIAFGPSGLYTTVDVGSHAFAWRLPGVALGSLTAGVLYLLARLLFRRRSIGLLFAGLLVMDGLLFQQSRIAMNDVYVGFFVVAGFTLLAWFLRSEATGRRAQLELLLVPPILGALFGLGLASKWVAAYAIGGAILLILLRSWLGRRIALAGMLVLTGVLGYLAVAGDPPNVVFLLLMMWLTALLGVGIVRGEARAGPRDRDGGPDRGPAWLQPRWRAGLPFAWVLGSLVVVALGVYVASYIPWALSTAGDPQLFAGWPAGHTGQSFLDLQAQMYKYHDEFRFPHGAGSPWWAWPLDLKPLWGYLETFVDGTQATVLGAGNPFLFWMSIPAVGLGAWLAWRRRSWALGFVVIAFLALWLPWARVDRVTFEYHYYAALPFAFLLLAWFLAELLERPSERLVRFARWAFGVVLFLPTFLWLFKGPLCVVAGVDRVDPGAAVCAAPITAFAVPVAAWTLVAIAVLLVGVIGTRPARMVGVMLGLPTIVSIALYPALSAARLPNGLPWVYQGLLPSWDSTFQFWSNTAPAVAHPDLAVRSLLILLVTVAQTAAVMWIARHWRTGAPAAEGGGVDEPPGDIGSWPTRDTRPVPETVALPSPSTTPMPDAGLAPAMGTAAVDAGGARVADVEVRRADVDVVVVGGGTAGLEAASAAKRTRRSVLVLDAGEGNEVVAVYPGPLVVARTPTGMLHVQARRVVVATGAAEIHAVVPGSQLSGLLTARAAERVHAAGIPLGDAVGVGTIPAGLSVPSVSGRLSRFEGDAAGRVSAIVTVDDRSGVETTTPCDTVVLGLGLAPRDVLARMAGPASVSVVGDAAVEQPLPQPPTEGVVCPCSGTTVTDLEDAWDRGFQELELLKRSSLACLGTCQGGACLPHVRSWIAARTGTVPEPFTARPASRQITLAEAAADTTIDVFRRTPLHDEHLALGARMDRFGGWWRPWNYGDVVAEYWAVRQGVSLGDVSTLGKLVVSGPDVVEFLERLYPCHVADIKPGRSRYALLLNERGHVMDDGMILRESETRFVLSFTSGGAANAEMWIRDWIDTWGLRVHVLDRTMSLAAINVTGPLAIRLLRRAGLPEPPRFLGHVHAEIAGVPCLVMRLSFTGEAAFELHHPVDRSVELWGGLMDLGRDLAIRPHGLQALFGLRLEKGHVIVGMDTELDTTPRRIGMDWAVRMEKPRFIGRAALERTAKLEDHRRWMGFMMDGEAPTEGMPIFAGGEIVGNVTGSWTSPLLGKALVLGWQKCLPFRDRVEIDGREAVVAPTPFYDPEGQRARA